jgi:hypothetical protein
MKELNVQGHTVIVDDDIAVVAARVGLSVVCSGRGDRRAYTRMRQLSSVILPAQRGYIVGHINGNPLDNRRENLQLLTAIDNARKKRVTPHPCVCEVRGRPGKYRVACGGGRSRHFTDFDEAKLAADAYRRSLGIRGMPLNFPQVGEHHWDGRLRTE